MDKLQPTCKQRCPKVSHAYIDIASKQLDKNESFLLFKYVFFYICASPYLPMNNNHI